MAGHGKSNCSIQSKGRHWKDHHCNRFSNRPTTQRVAVFVQSLAQLDMVYGREARQVIADNCQYKAILNATDADTQDYFSRLAGTYDKRKKSHNANYEQYTGIGKGTGASQTTEERRIIKPEEFATLEQIIMLSPHGFFKVTKTPYYKTRTFTN